MNTNSDNHQPAQVDDLADRLLERALAEVVGGETPPDLGELILAGKRPSEQVIADRVSRRRLSRRALISLVVAAMLLVALMPLLLSSIDVGRESSRELAFNRSSQFSEDTAAPAGSPGFTAPAATIPPPSPAVGGPGQVASSAIPAPLGGPAALPQLAAEGMLGPVDIRFIEGSNIVIIRGRQEDVEQVRQIVKELEAQQGVAAGGTPLAAEVPVANPDAEAWKRMSGSRRDRYGISDLETALQSQSGKVDADAGRFSNASADTFYYSESGTSTADFPRFTSDLDVPTRQNSFKSADRFGVDQAGKRTDIAALADANGRSTSRDRFQFGDGIGILDGVQPETWTEGLRPEKMTELGTGPGLSGDQYVRIVENPFIKAEGGAAVSTFSIDVDTASYTNVRRFLLTENALPPPDAVRIEELVNYFKYDYAPPAQIAKMQAADDNGAKGNDVDQAPFAAHIEVAGCPWKPEHRLVRIGIKGAEMDRRERPKSNLVFLVDVSGSMNEPNKLPLVVDSLKELARELGENDRVAIVVYAQQEGLVLPSTPGSQRETIIATLDRLRAGGSTAGGAGIQLAYQIAEDHFIEGGTNRVILCTDGDFNVGVTSTAELERLVEQKAKDTKVFLSVLGFGRGNLNDQMMEAVSNRGNGNYSYIDNLREARRVFVDEMSGTLVTIAKDVKIQVEFNHKQVAGYRLLGYENRMLRTEDFNDDKKDAGEIGAGHTVTALYEVVPAGQPVDLPPVDELRYQRRPDSNENSADKTSQDIDGELLTLKMKYKRPDAETSEDAIEWHVTDDGRTFSAASRDFQFAAAVAGFGMLLRGSEHKGNLTYAAAIELAEGGVGDDEHGYRAELVDMIRRAKTLKGE